MYEKLQKVYELKQKTKAELLKDKNKMIATIYGGIIKGKSTRQIHSELYDMTINNKKDLGLMYMNAVKITNRISKNIVNKEKLEQVDLAILVFGMLEDMKADKVLTSSIYNALNKVESDAKEKAIDNEIISNEKIGKVFYLASSHNDCAKDHYNAQGRMYVDGKWENYVKDKDTQDKIRSYIQKHNVRTLQYIMGKPVWFITRPNCRHYFKALDTESVLQYSAKELTRRHKLHRAVGDRQYLQTLQSGKDRQVIGETRNAQLVIERYKDRLEMHQELYKTFKSSLVRGAISKDKALINKWYEYLAKIKKA